jgi:predicted DNA-binding transcriptional regulator YafY
VKVRRARDLGYTAGHMPPPDERAAERRLLKLAGWFLAHGPATTEEVYAEFRAWYRGTPLAKEKLWTRDKRDLRRLGVPLRYAEDEGGTYALEPGCFYLPRITFLPAEAAVLTTAARAALGDADHPLRDDLEAALRKLLVGEAGLPPRAASLDLEPEPAAPAEVRRWLRVIADAVEERKLLHLRYWVPARDELTERDLEPYGYAWRRGEWLLVGKDHLRDAVRVFYLRRVRALALAKTKKKAPHFEVPEGFDVRDWSRQEPWEYFAHPPREATVRFTGSLAKIAPRLLPRARLATAPDNARLARVVVRNLDGLVRQCLAWGPEAAVVDPPEARERARTMLAAIAAPGEGAP